MATKTIRTRLPELEPRPRRQKQAVEPIRDLKTVRRIRKMLLERGKVRDALLFCVGCNNGLRISDLLNLKVGQVRDAKVNEKIRITEIKTGKANFLVMN